jgi:hypothetical protein
MNRRCPLERRLQPAEHRVERVSQLAQLISGAGQCDAGTQMVLGGVTSRRGDPVHRAQHPPSDDPAIERRIDRWLTR